MSAEVFPAVASLGGEKRQLEIRLCSQAIMSLENAQICVQRCQKKQSEQFVD